jgi:ribose transport system permease protein
MFFVLVLIFTIFSRNFLSFSNAVNIIRQASVLALAAFGQTLVLLIGGIDLSIGAVMGLTSCTTALLLVNGTPLGVAILAGILVAALCGLINGLVANYIGLNPFVATFGMWGMALGVALIITEERVIFGLPQGIRFFHDGRLLGVPVPLLFVAVIWVIMYYILKKTSGGMAVYATGGNAEASYLSGVRVKVLKTVLYTCSGTLAGLAGILFLSRANSAQAIDTIGYEFDSICAVVLGGTALAGGKGGVKETVVGVLLFATLRNGLNMVGVNLYLQYVFLGMILITANILESKRGDQKHQLSHAYSTGAKS